MEIKEITYKVKCDTGGCNNFAKYSVAKNTKIFKNNINFCCTCFEELFKFYSELKKPSAIKNKYSSKNSKKDS